MPDETQAKNPNAPQGEGKIAKVLYCTASWAGPCRAFDPVVEQQCKSRPELDVERPVWVYGACPR